MLHHGFFVLLQWIGATLSKTYEKKKKRYAYLVLENVGNFQIGYKDSIVVLTL